MKISTALAAAATMFLTPVAQAQIDCANVGALVEAAYDDFDALAGDEIEEDVFKAESLLGGSTDCNVAYSDWDTVYTCLWVFGSEAEADANFGGLTSTFRACLSGWESSVGTPGEPEGEYTPLKGYIIAGKGDFADMEWYLELDRHTFGDGTDWHVYAALSYLW